MAVSQANAEGGETMICARCASDLDHCHGTLVVHTDQSVECIEPRCADFDELRHAFVVGCEAIEGGCACDPDAVPLDTRVLEFAS